MQNIVKTKYGSLRGVQEKDYVVFKGIPYAAPPVGALRFKRPEPPAAWEGIREADRFGNISVQTLPTGEHSWDALYKKEFYDDPDYIPDTSEDCLYLNIWTPTAEPGQKLPVAFWIHGGGFGGGYGSEIEFDGAEYCRRGIILVSINYRCGVLGFLAHPWLSAEDEKGISGNYGIYDQIAALNWVYENIERFGGDPERITVFGQSAGCMSTQVLVSSGLTENRIKGAVLQSGVMTSVPYLSTPTLAEEEAYGERIVEITGVKDLAELRALPSDRLLAAHDQFNGEILQKMMSGEDPDGEGMLRIVPNVDGYLLKKNVREVFAEGSMKKIPYMAGCVADDLGRTEEDRRKNEPGLILSSCKEWCQKQEELGNPPAYAYLFTHRLPGEQGTDEAFHSAELWYTFGTLHRCWRPMKEEDYALSKEMLDAWASFIRTGKPGTDDSWAPCTKESGYVKVWS